MQNFADDQDRLWVYDRKTKEYRFQHIKDTAVEQYYYRVRVKDGSKSDEIERFFSMLEGHAAKAIKKILKSEALTTIDREHLALFISFQMTRVPDYEKRVNEMREKSMKKMNQMIFSSVERTKKVIEKYNMAEKITPEEMYKFIQEDKYKLKKSKEYSIKMALKPGYDFARYFLQMNWFFLYTPPKSSFITSDNPFTIFPPKIQSPFRGLGILTPGALKMFPISPGVCLVMEEPGDQVKIGVAKREKIRPINLYFAQTSDRFIFSRDEALLRSVVEKSQVDTIPFERERVFVG